MKSFIVLKLLTRHYLSIAHGRYYMSDIILFEYTKRVKLKHLGQGTNIEACKVQHLYEGERKLSKKF